MHYKLSGATRPESVSLARLLAEQVARFVVPGAPARSEDALRDPASIRSSILESGAPWVSFINLLDFCWAAGVPVVHISDLPASTKKMDGMAVPIGGRPAIVLTSGRRHAAWLLFLLAHELGHVCCGHLDDGSTFVDEDVDDEPTDPKEREANGFALALITGGPTTRVGAAGRRPGAEAEVRTAWQFLHRSGGEDDPAAVIQERMAANLNWWSLPSDAAEFVARLTGHVHPPIASCRPGET